MKLFITHGGYNSLLEACNSAVPILMMPLFLDQHGNARRAERYGIGLSIDKMDLSVESVVSAIKEMLKNDKYSLLLEVISCI